MGCFAENRVEIPYRKTAWCPSQRRRRFLCSRSLPEGVAQIFNLPYRRFLICKSVDNRDHTLAAASSLPESASPRGSPNIPAHA